MDYMLIHFILSGNRTRIILSHCSLMDNDILESNSLHYHPRLDLFCRSYMINICDYVLLFLTLDLSC
jgi:hypothetical protein